MGRDLHADVGEELTELRALRAIRDAIVRSSEGG
jgi:hypothetical protein